MLSLRRLSRPLAAFTVLFALTAVPAASFACDRDQNTSAGKHDKAKRHDQNFPLKADAFKEIVDKRLAHARERLNRVLAAHELPEAVQAQIKKEFEKGADAVRAAADRVGADGTVTKDEAKEVKQLARDLKRKAREKFQMGRKGGKRGNA